MRDRSLSAACSLYHGVIGRYLLETTVELRQCTELDMFECPVIRNGSHQTSLHCKSRSSCGECVFTGLQNDSGRENGILRPDSGTASSELCIN